MFREEVLFTPEECNYLLSLAKEWKVSKVQNDKDGKFLDNQHRNSEQSRISNKQIEDLIIPKIKKLNIVSLSSECDVIKYKVGSFFGKHKDNSRNGTKHRKQSVVIQLSEESDYEGGELIISNTVVNKTIGNTIVFDSGLIHEVTKLTKGTRYSFIGWVTENNKTKQMI